MFFADSFDPVVRDDNGDDEPSASSARSKVKSRVRNEHNQGFLAGVAIGAAAGALVLLAILGMALYRKFWCKSLHSINFDNPVYRKSAEEAVNLERDPSSVSMTSTVTTSNMSASSSVVVGAKRSYTSNTLATDVSEVRSLIKSFVIIHPTDSKVEYIYTGNSITRSLDITGVKRKQGLSVFSLPVQL